MHELVVISGKGGTGKTSIVASFAALADGCVLADADVDAADLHLVLNPSTVTREPFSGGSRAEVKVADCTACGNCADVCRFDAVTCDGPCNDKGATTYRIDPISCGGCGVCAHFCPAKAIEVTKVVNGELFVSDTRYGPMVHAQLGVAEENSGKLVSLVRARAKTIAQEQKLGLVLIDGSPGIGCPVISSISGADYVLVVTEPTPSGLHDLRRVTDLTSYFGIQTQVCVNKWDLNRWLTAEIEREASDRHLRVAGRIRYDQAVTRSQIKQKSIVEYACNGAALDIRELWSEVSAVVTAAPPTAAAGGSS